MSRTKGTGSPVRRQPSALASTPEPVQPSPMYAQSRRASPECRGAYRAISSALSPGGTGCAVTTWNRRPACTVAWGVRIRFRYQSASGPDPDTTVQQRRPSTTAVPTTSTTVRRAGPDTRPVWTRSSARPRNSGPSPTRKSWAGSRSILRRRPVDGGGRCGSEGPEG